MYKLKKMLNIFETEEILGNFFLKDQGFQGPEAGGGVAKISGFGVMVFQKFRSKTLTPGPILFLHFCSVPTLLAGISGCSRCHWYWLYCSASVVGVVVAFGVGW